MEEVTNAVEKMDISANGATAGASGEEAKTQGVVQQDEVVSEDKSLKEAAAEEGKATKGDKPKEAAAEEVKPKDEASAEEVKPKETAAEEEKPKETAAEEEKPKETAAEEEKPKETAAEEEKPKETAAEEEKPKETAPQEEVKAIEETKAPEELKPADVVSDSNAANEAEEPKEAAAAEKPSVEGAAAAAAAAGEPAVRTIEDVVNDALKGAADAENISEAVKQAYVEAATGAPNAECCEARLLLLNKLQGLETKQAEFEAQMDTELMKIKHSWQSKFAGLWEERRAALVEGASAEGKYGTKTFPKFWLRVLQNFPRTKAMIQEEDEDALSYIEDITWKYQDGHTFELTFVFSENPYFEQRELTKLVVVEVTRAVPTLNSMPGTEIKWKTGKDLTKNVITKKQRNKKTKETRTVTQIVDKDSFFSFFKSYTVPDREVMETMGEEEVAELELNVDTDYYVATGIKDKLIPYAAGWFMGDEVDESAESSDSDEDDSSEEDDSDEGSD
eukprot:GHVU01017829.1.p1 GENE.GHVU01017829.1~~GHVU01017829.1.p1  ORF type:complete len:505 (+),score=192.79 GHVU01017829.1:102-1616(+)